MVSFENPFSKEPRELSKQKRDISEQTPQGEQPIQAEEQPQGEQLRSPESALELKKSLINALVKFREKIPENNLRQLRVYISATFHLLKLTGDSKYLTDLENVVETKEIPRDEKVNVLLELTRITNDQKYIGKAIEIGGNEKALSPYEVVANLLKIAEVSGSPDALNKAREIFNEKILSDKNYYKLKEKSDLMVKITELTRDIEDIKRTMESILKEIEAFKSYAKLKGRFDNEDQINLDNLIKNLAKTFRMAREVENPPKDLENLIEASKDKLIGYSSNLDPEVVLSVAEALLPLRSGQYYYEIITDSLSKCLYTLADKISKYRANVPGASTEILRYFENYFKVADFLFSYGSQKERDNVLRTYRTLLDNLKKHEVRLYFPAIVFRKYFETSIRDAFGLSARISLEEFSRKAGDDLNDLMNTAREEFSKLRPEDRPAINRSVIHAEIVGVDLEEIELLKRLGREDYKKLLPKALEYFNKLLESGMSSSDFSWRLFTERYLKQLTDLIALEEAKGQTY